MATLAQNESKKTSMRVKAGQMVSFQNGVIYGTGMFSVMIKWGRSMSSTRHRRKRSVKVYDLYLAGNGYQKIKKQLEKDGDLTAMGKSLWHYATMGHILKNRLYCGELEYRKEYVPDYLEQKRANNNGAGASHRGGQAPAHRHQRGIRAGAEDDGGKERADGAVPEEQGHLFGRPLAQKVFHAVFDDPEGTLLDAAAVLGCGIAGVEQAEVLQDKEIIEEKLKKEQGRYETLLDMQMNNEIPKRYSAASSRRLRSGSQSWNSR